MLGTWLRRPECCASFQMLKLVFYHRLHGQRISKVKTQHQRARRCRRRRNFGAWSALGHPYRCTHPLGTIHGLTSQANHSAAAGAILCGECACECLRAQSVTHGGISTLTLRRAEMRTAYVAPRQEMPNKADPSSRMLCCAPPRAQWRASAG